MKIAAGALMLLLLLMSILGLGVWIVALYRAATTDLFARRERGIWVVFIAVFNLLGAIAFLFAMDVMRKYRHRNASTLPPTKDRE